MGKYTITLTDSGHSCQPEESQGLPLVLQHYYTYLNTGYRKSAIKYVVSFEEGQNSRLDITLLANEQITKEDMGCFFEHWDYFIDWVKEQNKTLISVVIEGNDLVLEAYKDHKVAKQQKLDAQQKKISIKVDEDMKPTVLKWTSGVSTALCGVGFALGGPIGAFCGAGLGLAFGPFIGLNATSSSNLSAATQKDIAEYTMAKYSANELENRLMVIPLKEIPALEQEEEAEHKLPVTKQADQQSVTAIAKMKEGK